MNETPRMVRALKQVLRAKGLRYRDVAAALDLSEASIKRIFADETFTLARLEQICALVELSVLDLARMAEQAEPMSTLTLEQESALVADPQVFHWFYRLLHAWTPERLAAADGVTPERQVRILAALDRLGLIELQPGDRVRVLTAPTIRWRKGGPVRRAYEAKAKSDFLGHRFDGESDFLALETAELSPASAEVLKRHLAHAVREFVALTDLDATLPHERKTHFGLVVAFRPWVFDLE